MARTSTSSGLWRLVRVFSLSPFTSAEPYQRPSRLIHTTLGPVYDRGGAESLNGAETCYTLLRTRQPALRIAVALSRASLRFRA